MKNPLKVFTVSTILFFSLSTESCKNRLNSKSDLTKTESSEEKDKYDGPDKAAEFEFMRTKDPALNIVPTDRLLIAKQATIELKAKTTSSMSGYGNWVERGPNSDVTGSSNGNTRANNGISSGRIRAVLVDAADATGKTVFIAGVDGGLWTTTDITVNPANWTIVNDFLSNLAITDITQDPTNANTMYFCTGEAFFNGDAVSGVGVFKSTNHGVTWALLPSTSTYTFCSRIVCDAAGNVYLGTRNYGLLRSLDQGTSWADITPSGYSLRIADLEISSSGRLHVTTGLGNVTNGVYRFTDIPSTVTSSTWTSATTPFPYPSGGNCRVEMGCRGNTLYVLPSNNSAQVATIYKSSDGGATWTVTTAQPPSGWASGQAWYALSIDINPADVTQFIVGGLDPYKATNSGGTWTKLADWTNNSTLPPTTTQYVHADIHKIIWYDGGNKLLLGCDGGIHFSADGGTTISDRNTGLRIKQFYSVAAHPTNLNYFLAGAQDNGVHQFSNAGLSSTVEVTGGDGAYTAIDQDQPTYQFGSYVYNTFRRSTDGGTSWNSINFYLGTNTSASNFGNFINAFSFDNTANNIYAAGSAGSFFRWTNPQSQAAGNYYAGGSPSWPATASQVSLTALNSSSIFAVTVSPYTSNKVYFGTSGGRVCYADAANTITTGSSGTNISTGLPSGAVSCIATGTDDNNLMVSYSSYGINHVFISTNNGSSWTNIAPNSGGSLPDMPVRWCMFAPGSNTKAIIATETGVWFTQAFNGASTVWSPSPGFPAVRTDMLAYRPLDGTIAAATHGRGLWTQTAASILPLNNFNLRGRWTGNNVDLNWNYENFPTGAIFEIESSTNAIAYAKIGTVNRTDANNYSFKYIPPTTQNLFYRIKGIEQTGSIKYSNIVRLFKSNNNTNGNVEITKLYPNPVNDLMSISFLAPKTGTATYTVTAVNGQVIWRKQEKLDFLGTYNITESAAALKPGSYIFTILLNGQKSSQPFIKK